MNIRAKCINKACAAYEKEKSVFVGQLLGYGAPNERVICSVCGSLMKTTQTSAPSDYGRDCSRPSGRRSPSRSVTGRKPARRKSTRSTGRRSR